MSKFPHTIVLLDGTRHKVVKVHHQFAKGVYRVEWYTDRPKGCLAYVDARLFHEVSQEEVLADVRKTFNLREPK